MTYIIGEPCVDVLDRACVDVCPVDCIYEAEEHKMLLINPEECIDCAACEPVCPVMAIFAEEDVINQQKEIENIQHNSEIKKILQAFPGVKIHSITEIAETTDEKIITDVKIEKGKFNG